MPQNYAFDYDEINELESFYNPYQEDDGELNELLSFYGMAPEPEPEEEIYEPVEEPIPVVEPEPVVPEDTQYNFAGALKQAGYQVGRAMGGSLPSMIGKIIPGDDPIERIGTENKAQYDAWMKQSPDIQKHQQSVAKGTEGFLPEVVGSAGPTVAALVTSIIPVVGPYLAAAEFLDLNKEEIYDQAKAKGADEDTAQVVSWTGGAINSALDMTGLGALKRIFRPGKKITKFLVDYALATQVEGGTEAVQDVVGKVATEYSIKPKDESETDFMSRMWEKKGELVADTLHAYKIGAGTAALFGGPAGVHQAVTGQLKGDVEPPNPDKEKILPTTKIDPLLAKANGIDVAATTGIITQHEPIAEKDTNTLNRLAEDTTKKAQARQLKEAADLMEAQRLEAVPINREQFVAALTDPNDETTINDYEQFGLKPEEITDIQKAAETPPPEPIVEPEPIQKDALPDIKEIIGKIPEGTMVDIEEQDIETGDVTTVQADAMEELKKTDTRYETLTKIMSCLG